MAKIATVVVLVAVCAFGLSTGMYMYMYNTESFIEKLYPNFWTNLQ